MQMKNDMQISPHNRGDICMYQQKQEGPDVNNRIAPPISDGGIYF